MARHEKPEVAFVFPPSLCVKIGGGGGAERVALSQVELLAGTYSARAYGRFLPRPDRRHQLRQLYSFGPGRLSLYSYYGHFALAARRAVVWCSVGSAWPALVNPAKTVVYLNGMPNTILPLTAKDGPLVRSRLRRATTVCGAEWIRSALLLKYPWLDPARCYAVPNAVDLSAFCPMGGDADGGRGITVGYAGALDIETKQVDLLWRVAREVSPAPIRLLVAGSSDLWGVPVGDDGRLATLIGNPPPNMSLLGIVPHTQMPAFWRSVDVAIHTSRSESTPLCVLEAMACGKPVVAFGIPGVRELVQDGQEGLLAEPFDVSQMVRSLQLLATSPDLRKRLGVAARQKAERFSWEAHMGPLVNIFNRVAGGVNARARL